MNKKTPLKAADQTLVQGAYRAAMGGQGRQQDGMSQGMDKLMDISADAVKTIAQNRRDKQKEGKDIADKIMTTGGDLGQGWLDVVTTEVEGQHADYKKAAQWGRKNKMGKASGELQSISAEVATIKESKDEVVDLMMEKSENGGWSEAITAKEYTVFNAFISPDSKKRITKDDNGARTFEVYIGEEEGWMTTGDINKMVEGQKKDYGTMVDVRDQIIKAKESGANRSKGGPQNASDFDKEKTVAKMDATLKKSNLNSLMHDDVLENGVPFIEAIKSNPEITGMHYEDLGLYDMTREQQDAMLKADVNNDGIIQEGEKKTLLESGHQDMIVDALTNPENPLYNEKTTRGLMANYFTGSIEKNYNDGYNSNAASSMPLDQWLSQVNS